MIHTLHPTAKFLSTIALLVAVSTLQKNTLLACALYLLLLMTVAALARLPLLQMLASAAVILPFAATFAVISLLAGEPSRAASLVARSYTSALAALLLVATTPMPDLIAGLEVLRVPRFLLLVMQFLYRYLVVLIEEAVALRDAGASRGGTLTSLQLRHAGAAAGILFSRAYYRASAIHQAMLARGFEGNIPVLSRLEYRWADLRFSLLSLTLAAGIRVAAR